jgi:hypothetical protein
MGTVYKKSATRALPPDAELFTRKGESFARWKDAKGQSRTAPVTTGLERWLANRAAVDMSPSMRNEYRQEAIGFANWCVRSGRLVANPFANIPKADAKADCRRKRRSLTEPELQNLLFVAQRRPLADDGRLTVRKDEGEQKAKRDTWTAKPLAYGELDAAVKRARQRLVKSPAFVEQLERQGRERALI